MWLVLGRLEILDPSFCAQFLLDSSTSAGAVHEYLFSAVDCVPLLCLQQRCSQTNLAKAVRLVAGVVNHRFCSWSYKWALWTACLFYTFSLFNGKAADCPLKQELHGFMGTPQTKNSTGTTQHGFQAALHNPYEAREGMCTWCLRVCWLISVSMPFLSFESESVNCYQRIRYLQNPLQLSCNCCRSCGEGKVFDSCRDLNRHLQTSCGTRWVSRNSTFSN